MNVLPIWDLVLEKDVAVMSWEEFHQLLEYSASLPTGTTIGKKWRCRRGGRWWLGTYVEEADPKFKKLGYVGIRWYRICIDPYGLAS